MIRYQKDTANIVTLTFDMEGGTANIVNHQMWSGLAPVLERLKKEKSRGRLRGVILTSAKKTFLSGGRLERLLEERPAAEIFEDAQRMKGFLRELESPGIPVVAALNGSALGPGFEIALACHHRILFDRPQVEVGLPEIRLGLLPGAGGSIRLMWLLGLRKCWPILSQGKTYTPQQALRSGLVDALAASRKSMLEMARQWLLTKPEGRRPWDLPAARIPGGDSRGQELARFVQDQLAELQLRPLPHRRALENLLHLLYESSRVDFDTAGLIESRYYTRTLTLEATRNLLRSLYLDREQVLKGATRPTGYGRFRPRRVGIIGAGRMGSGIALACLQHGMEVVLKDISALVAERGRSIVTSKLSAAVKRGELEEKQLPQLLSQIRTTENPREFATCDLIIEAVFEHPNVKRKVTREAEEYLDEYAIFGTNTVSIPITELANSAQKPAQYIGLHFFAPADRAPLVEIVRGAQTSGETVARAFDFVRQIGKVPIIVKDDWGFYAARVQNTYLLEGITMLQEGIPPALIEHAGTSCGMPAGPLLRADRLGLDLAQRYENQAAAHYGKKYIQHPAVSVIREMLEQQERSGQAKGKGFYDYDTDGQPTGLWPGLAQLFEPAAELPSPEELQQRLLIAQVLEGVWCLQEKVIRTLPEANLGSIYGWGFPAELGGVIQFISGKGLKEFSAICEELQSRFGPRFRIPPRLPSILSQIREQTD